MPKIDRNARARLMYCAEALDRRTRYPKAHGGVLRRAGLAVLRALLFHFHNAGSGRCDPGIDRLASAAGVARSTCLEALKRLEAFGFVTRVRRRLRGPWGSRQTSNRYAFGPAAGPGSGNRTKTTNKSLEPKSARIVPDRWPEPPPRRGHGAILASARRLGIPLRPDPATG